jgi:hypothetical protein
MAELSGTNLAGSIVPFTTDDTFATHLAKFGKGGWRSVADIAERDGITADRREAGMAVYVVAEKKVYTLESDLVTWTELKTGPEEITVKHDDTLQGEGTEESPLGLSDTVKSDIAGKADKADTLAGYGITDAYTKTETDAKLGAVYHAKGSVADYNSLPNDATVGDVYNLLDTGANYVWTESGWDKLSETVDLSGKADKSEIPTQVSQLENDSGYVTQADLEGASLPDQTGNSGKYLSTDGENLSWEKVNDYTAGEGLVLAQPFENENYKQVEYIESTGDIYVDTGVLDNPNYEYKARFQPTNIDKTFSTLFGYLAGNITSAPSKAIRIEVQDGVKSIAIGYTDDGAFAGKMYTAGAMDELAWHNVSYNKTSVELDGAKLLEFNPYPNAFPAKMVLFGAWVGYSSNPSSSNWSYRTQYAGKISSFEVYENTDGTPVLIHNFIPVKSKTTNEAGFYDTINDTFHPVVSSVEQATWQQGPESAIVIELEQPVPQVSLNAGKFLTNDGKKLYWADVASGGGSLPDQTDNAGKFLMTDGTDVSWQKAIQNNATVDTAIAIGGNAQATYDNSVAIGSSTVASGKRSIAIGFMTYVYKFGGTDQIVIGPESKTISDYAIALGTKAIVDSNSSYSIAIGYNAKVKNPWSVAIGYNAQALSHDQVVIGPNAAAANKYSVAIGHSAQATGEESVQLGRGENTQNYSLQFRDYTVIREDGTIPPERLSPEPPAEGFTLVYDERAGELRWGKVGGGETAGTEVIIRRWN